MKINKWLILLGVAVPSLMIEMAGTSVFVAMEPIASDFNVTMGRAVWLTTMYLVANAMMIPLAGWLGRRWGYKRVILLSVFIFTASSMLGGLAGSFESLIVFRAIQGMGDGPIMPIVTALLLETFPAKDRGKMISVLILATAVAPVLGPLLASWVIEGVGWRGIFYMNVIWGILSLVAVMLLIPAGKPAAQHQRVNWVGFFLLAVGTGSLQLFLDRGQDYDWFRSGGIIALFVIAAVAISLFLIITLYKKDGSVLDLRTLKDPYFLIGNIANMLVIGILYGALLVKVIYLQFLMGFSPGHTGIAQAAFGGAMLVSSMIAGWMTDKISPRWPMLFGIPVCFYGIHLASRFTLYNDLPSILWVGSIIGFGFGLVVVPMTVALFATISQKDMAGASVLNSYLMVISSSISMAVATLFLTSRMEINGVYLTSAIKPDNPVVQQVLHSTQADLALLSVYEQIMRQAAMISFSDVFYLISFLFLAALLYLPFMKKAPLDLSVEHDEPRQ